MAEPSAIKPNSRILIQTFLKTIYIYNQMHVGGLKRKWEKLTEDKPAETCYIHRTYN